MAWDRKVPFNERGSLMPYVSSWEDQQGVVTWRDNYEFEATMVFSNFRRGRSAAHAVFTWEGKAFQMFLKELEDILLRAKVGWSTEPGKPACSSVQGRWTFVKRGQNYGIKLVERK